MEKQPKVKVTTTENLRKNVAKVVTDDKCILTMEAEIIKGDYKFYQLRSSKGIMVLIPQSDCEIKTNVKSKNKKK